MTRLLLLLMLGLSGLAISHGQCDIDNLAVIVDACDSEQKFTAKLTFTDTNQANKKYIVQGNGVDYGVFSYMGSIEIGPLDGDCNTPYEFVVRDEADPTCGDFVDLGQICCSSDCPLKLEIANVSACSSDETFAITFSLENIPPNSPGMQVSVGNIPVGTVSYNALVPTITIPWDGNQTNDIVVCDQLAPTCCKTFTVQPPCACNINDLRYDIVNCDPTDSTYSVILNADYLGVSDSFSIGSNATNLGTFGYDQLPLVLGPFDFDSNKKIDFVMADQNDLFCFDFVEPGVIDSCPPPCHITLDTMVSACSADRTIDVTLLVENDRPGIYGYAVIVDGVAVDTALYSSGDYTLTLNSDCDSVHNIGVLDLYHPGCSDGLIVQPRCCPAPCEISNIQFMAFCEIDGGTGFSLNFTHDLAADDLFDLYIDGVLYQSYTASDLPLADNTYQFLSGQHNIRIVGRDGICEAELDVNLDCIRICDYGPITFTTSDCYGSDMVDVTLDFTFNNTPSDSFDLYVDNVLIGRYAYDDAYTVALSGDCITNYNFQVADAADPVCGTSGTLMGLCCTDCELDISNVTFSDCGADGTVAATISVSSNIAASDSFDLRGNGTEYGRYAYSDSPVMVTLTPDCSTVYEFVVVDIEESGCSVDWEADDALCCVDCSVEIGGVDFSDCSADGTVAATISVSSNIAASDSFDLRGNGTEYGRYAYSDSPVMVTLTPDCSTVYEFIVVDIEESSCSAEWGADDALCCVDCSVEIGGVDFSDCGSDGTVTATINVSGNEAASDSFDLRGNGMDYGRYAYADSPVSVTLTPDCSTVYEFVVVDSEESGCSVDWGAAEALCCVDCSVEIGGVDFSDCGSDGTVTATINVSGNEAASDSFDLRGNGMDYGRYAYADSPVSVTLTPDCSTIYEFVVVDSEELGCSVDWEADEALCCTDCSVEIGGVDFSDCGSDGTVTATINVSGNEAASDSFDLRGNGMEYGRYAYSDSPVTVTLTPDCSTVYEFIVVDIEESGCSADWGADDALCCTDCSVEIGGVDFSDCGSDGTVTATINVSGNEAASDSFDLRGNGMEYGRYAYADGPVTVTLTPDCSTVYEFVVVDIEESGCSADWGADDALCCTDCSVEIGGVDFSDCGADGTVTATINVSGNEAASDSFDLRGNGVEYGRYAYADSPVSVTLTPDCSTVYEFVAVDIEESGCSADWGADEVLCCDSTCVLELFDPVYSDCDSGRYDVTFEIEGNQLSGDFRVSVNGNEQDYEVDGDKITVLGLNGDGNTYVVVIADNQSEDCSDFFEVSKLCTVSTDEVDKWPTSVHYAQGQLNILSDAVWWNEVHIFNVSGQKVFYAERGANSYAVDFGPHTIGIVVLNNTEERKVYKVIVK